MIETPQYFLLRVACGLSRTAAEAIELLPADVVARLPAELADPVQLGYPPPADVLLLPGRLAAGRAGLDLRALRAGRPPLKFAGGIGIAWSRVRSRGALIRGTNGKSNGIVPFLRTLDSSVAAVNQGGRRKGAACVYLEPWHPDIEEFLELRDNTGEDARRTHNLNLANWIPDEFMRRVEADDVWSLIDPDQVPELPDLWGEAFDTAYRKAEAEGRLRPPGLGPRPVRAG